MSPPNQTITTKDILDLFDKYESQSNARLDRYQDSTQKQYEKITDNMGSMATSISELATSIKISEDHRCQDNKRMTDIEKRQSCQGNEMNQLIIKVEKNSWVSGSAVKAFMIILTAFLAGYISSIFKLG